MSSFYDEMREFATEMLGEFKQGAVKLKRVTTAPGPNEWTPGPEVETLYDLSATVRRIHQRYEGGVLIVETGDQVLFAVSSVTPALTDTLVIDGRERAITNLTPIPAAGEPVVWKAWCAA
ncbi:hypothetical protein [Chelativorans sp.]|uniref:hypothetical protein n=1 Tax=Chelativorans sp. TaxID=2203393 RepID=UPI002811947D|nr:hypothetical protein [Chelativorans sp.]